MSSDSKMTAISQAYSTSRPEAMERKFWLMVAFTMPKTAANVITVAARMMHTRLARKFSFAFSPPSEPESQRSRKSALFFFTSRVMTKPMTM